MTTLVATFAAPWSQAEYLWIERAAGQPAKAYLSEYQPTEHLPLAALQNAQQRLAGDKHDALRPSGDALVFDAATPGDVRVRATRADGKALTVYEAREGRGETKAVNDLELVPTTPGGDTFKLSWKGTTVAASQVNVYTSEQWSRTLKPGADGNVTLNAVFPARYVLEVVAQVNGKVTVDGQSYDSVTHVATLSFEVKP
jgi:hypothetical protein